MGKELPDILLIEDEESHVELIRRAFEESEFQAQLLVATTLAAAREHLEFPPVELDLVIADWRLPDGDALDLVRSAKQHLPIIVMTSHGNERVAVEAIRAGALDYVVKSEYILADMPHIAERAIQQWQLLNERTEMESSLRKNEEMLHTVVNNAPLVLFALDHEGRFTLSEGRGLSILNLHPGEMVGRSVEEIYARSPAMINSIYRALQGEAHSEVIDVSGVQLDSWFSPVQNTDGRPQGVIGVSTDVTARMQAEEQLQNALRQLSEAYEATIEGWAKALELRERETAGHSRRVVELTLELARRMGIPEEKMQAVRYGSLLHDIGKLAVPDHILLKPSSLSEDEWTIMRQHPIYSMQLLSGIAYLSAAIDIPYNHHESWDGSGYPRGLKGEEIPLSARIFAAVDVWDALTSDRPYRLAWSREATLTHICRQSGTKFDPQVVRTFAEIIQSSPWDRWPEIHVAADKD